MIRIALLNLDSSRDWEEQERVVNTYMPGNYRAVAIPDAGSIVIAGTDYLGWSLDDYVIPRLRSGGWYAVEIERREPPRVPGERAQMHAQDLSEEERFELDLDKRWRDRHS